VSLPPLKNVKKAYVYMIRRHHLLVHEHVDYPEMPLALPGGTLERGEFPNLAARREAEEETGLSGGFGNMRLIGKDVQVHVRHRMKMDRWFYLSFPKVPLPQSWESWEMTPSDWHEPVLIRWFWLPLSEMPERSWNRVLRQYMRRRGLA
jgi:8-oxo-dGTP pyrophosphatase MutT (NUDIX family)